MNPGAERNGNPESNSCQCYGKREVSREPTSPWSNRPEFRLDMQGFAGAPATRLPEPYITRLCTSTAVPPFAPPFQLSDRLATDNTITFWQFLPCHSQKKLYLSLDAKRLGEVRSKQFSGDSSMQPCWMSEEPTSLELLYTSKKLIPNNASTQPPNPQRQFFHH